MATERNRPIGVFDSGLGGLTVVKEMMRQLPQEDIVYFGDTARVPYGTKSQDAIVSYSIENTQALLEHHVKMVVVACNSSSSFALEALRAKFSLPVIDVIAPGVEAAVRATRNQKVGVIATSATVNSGSYARKFPDGIKVYSQACPLFVPLAEEGKMKRDIVEAVARQYLTPLMKRGIDTLILGCTHYPILQPAIRRVVGKDVKLVNSARAVTRGIQTVLDEQALSSRLKRPARHQFLISDRPQDFERIARKFLGMPILTG